MLLLLTIDFIIFILLYCIILEIDLVLVIGFCYYYCLFYLSFDI